MRKALLGILVLATIIEVALGAGILIAPNALIGAFKISAVTPDLLYLAAIVGWFCLLAAAFACLAIRWVWQSRREGRTLSIFLGLFWILIGLHLGLAFGRPDHLVLDAAKGLILFVLALGWKPAPGHSLKA